MLFRIDPSTRRVEIPRTGHAGKATRPMSKPAHFGILSNCFHSVHNGIIHSMSMSASPGFNNLVNLQIPCKVEARE